MAINLLPGITKSLSSWRLTSGHAAHYLYLVALPLAVAGGLCWAGCHSYGIALSPPVAQEAAKGSAANLASILFALAVILCAGQVCARCCAYLRQPPVIGEVAAGIALGPSLLGSLAPDTWPPLIAPGVLPIIEAIGQLGIILFMFMVGLEVDFRLLRRQAGAAVLVSHAGIAFPLVGGVFLGLVLYPQWCPSNLPFLPFALFLGLAMSVTAFPVLTRIVRDRQMQNSQVGLMALASAAADDLSAWCLLACLVGMSHANLAQGVLVLLLAGTFVVLMFALVRPLMKRLLRWGEGDSSKFFPLLMLGLLGSALLSEQIGIHALLGAFLFGLCVPRDAMASRSIRGKLEDVVGAVLMPAFFIYSGMRTDITLLDSPEAWLIFALVVAVATAGKFLGALVPARITGSPWKEALSLGALMNTRGLMEIVIANVGLECGFIPPRIHTMLVLMALVTTMATGPLLTILQGRQRLIASAATS